MWLQPTHDKCEAQIVLAFHNLKKIQDGVEQFSKHALGEYGSSCVHQSIWWIPLSFDLLGVFSALLN